VAWVLLVVGARLAVAGAAPAPVVLTAAPPEVVAEVRAVVERARLRFEARDAGGVLSHVSEQYRSAGLTKADVRQQLLAMFALYEAVRARVAVERVQSAPDGVWLYTSGALEGRLPLVGWVTFAQWQSEPEVARREGREWRLFGFQN
jgi:hypothetical protein